MFAYCLKNIDVGLIVMSDHIKLQMGETSKTLNFVFGYITTIY